MIWGEVPRGLVIIIVALFRKKMTFFFKAVKAADNILRDLPELSRGEIMPFQRLKNDSTQQPATCLMEHWTKRSMTVLMPWPHDCHVVSQPEGPACDKKHIHQPETP